ncbi:patatin-like phospholipase family protein [Flavobacterium sp. K5-23]|uniref:patatin-like phospholipase family protein n=1 Tax=Flavobacterium sp. K5-23 TaxID=2746225 RepID=UPI00200D0B5F|nr:patatin-like phospholipase family protein [Flavobacterium sp. K5-23]UQD56519.1 patatin-like phospholipase family protein [Flavobacterium sp. K5-23]
MNALVISGGGSKGAFAGGISEYLINQCKKEYSIYIGTSTGSLLVPFLAIGDLDRIKKIYTTIRQEDVFSVSPFIVKKKNGILKTKINHFGMITQFIKNRKTFGNSDNLRNLIRNNFTESDFEKLKVLNKEVVVTVANFTKQIVEHKSSNDYNYDDFCDWIWASANLVPLMSLLSKNGEEYGDGGFGNLIPVQEAIKKGATAIDVIVLRLEKRVYDNPPLHNAMEVLLRSFDFMLNQIVKDDLIIARLEAANKHVAIHFYYIDQILTVHPYIFDADQMKKWWQQGFELFQNKSPLKHHIKPPK